jgi:hypothetical protein
VALVDALAIVVLLARREPDNYPRGAARLVGRLALERPLEIIDVRDATSPCSPSPTPASPNSGSSANSGASTGDQRGACRPGQAPHVSAEGPSCSPLREHLTGGGC